MEQAIGSGLAWLWPLTSPAFVVGCLCRLRGHQVEGSTMGLLRDVCALWRSTTHVALGAHVAVRYRIALPVVVHLTSSS